MLRRNQMSPIRLHRPVTRRLHESPYDKSSSVHSKEEGRPTKGGFAGGCRHTPVAEA